MDDAKQAAKVSLWLVEDNVHLRDAISTLINRSGDCECNLVFDSCEDAINGLRGAEPPEAILLDVGLNAMSGIEGVKILKEMVPSVHIIMLTIHEDNNLVFDALCSGASGYLLKDSPPEQIIRTIKEVKAGGAPMNARIAKKVIDMFRQFNPPKGDHGLTERERNVLNLLVSGLGREEIAQRLHVSFRTVNSDVRNIYDKLQANTRGAAVKKGFKDVKLQSLPDSKSKVNKK